MFPKIVCDALREISKAHGDVEERRFSPAGRIVFSSRGFPHVARKILSKIFAAIALLLTLSLAVPWARAQNPAPTKPTADLPTGPMQAKATTACLECHEARIILQQRLSKPAWTKEVDKMTKWGAVVDAADRDALIDYLSTNFSADKPPYEPVRTAAADMKGKASKIDSCKKKQSATDPMSMSPGHYGNAADATQTCDVKRLEKVAPNF